MGKKNLNLCNIEIEETNFTAIKGVDVEKVLGSNKIFLVKKKTENILLIACPIIIMLSH